jgi:hypothetical protein
VIDEAELRQMTLDERLELARRLALMDMPHPLGDDRVRRRRRFGLLLLACCCLFLAAWIAILVLTLPAHYTSHDWRTVWVGLDIAELAAFTLTLWAAWHQRQIVVFLMIITGTLLVCDAWFDLALNYGSHGFAASIVSAVVVEFPLAFVMFSAARRLTRANVQIVMHTAGIPGPAPALWRIPLFAAGLEAALPPLLRRSSADSTASSSSALGCHSSRPCPV